MFYILNRFRIGLQEGYFVNKLNRRVTMKDIAKVTGYSINTVSHALNGKGGVGDESIQVIMETANKLGYIANTNASSLRSGNSKSIAIIIPDIINPFFSIMIKLFEEELREKGYSTLIMNTNENIELEEKAVISAISKNVDGIIICPSQQSEAPMMLMKQNGIPFVLFSRDFEDGNYECVLPDETTCAYIATKHLLDLGHKKILFLNSQPNLCASKNYLKGYERALWEKKIPLNTGLVKYVETLHPENTADEISHIMKGLDFTSIFSVSDNLSYLVISTLKKNGLFVPKDVSVVSIDNVNSHIFFPISLTSVDVSKRETAHVATELLLNLMKNGAPQRKIKKVITPTLVIGETTRTLNS